MRDIELGFLATLGEILFWLVVAAGIGALAWVAYLNRHLFTGSTRPAASPPPEPRTRTVMGLDIASDTLPDDIPAAALEAWRNGNPQLATSLLYRGAICWLVESAKLPLADSDTEGDCLQHCNGISDVGRRDYFSQLTAEWISTAYNHVPPSDASMQQMCATWPFDLREASR